MPTSKQTRYHVTKIRKLYRALSEALNKAHTLSVIQYENYNEESPCKCLFQSEDRFDKSVEKSLLSAINSEINKDAYK